MAELLAGRDAILCLAFADDGTTLWAGSDSADEGQTLWSWELSPLQLQGQSHPAHYRTSALVCRDSRLLSGGGEDDGNWMLWSLPAMTLLARGGDDEGEVLSVALATEAWGVLRAADDGLTVELWRPESDRPVWRSAVESGELLAFSPSGDTLYVLGKDPCLPLFVATGRAGKALRGAGLKLTAKGLTGSSARNGELFAAPDAACASGKALLWGEGSTQGWHGKRLLWKHDTPAPALVTLASHPRLPWLAGVRGTTALLWDEQGCLLWSYDLKTPCYRLVLDGQGRWLGIPGETVRYLDLRDGHLAHQGPENFAAGSGTFGRGVVHPDFQPWPTDLPDLWTPVLASDQEWAVTWDGRAVNLRTGDTGIRYQGLGGSPTYITVTEAWVGLANDTWVAVFDRETGQLRHRTEAWGNANSGVAYSRCGQKALRARFHQLQLWDLQESRILASLDTDLQFTAVAGWDPFFAGDTQGRLHRVLPTDGAAEPRWKGSEAD
jgi:hypothetical protein